MRKILVNLASPIFSRKIYERYTNKYIHRELFIWEGSMYDHLLNITLNNYFVDGFMDLFSFEVPTNQQKKSF